MSVKKYFISIFILVLNFNLNYGQFSPNFKNYSISDYEGGNKNWGISFDRLGRVYVANNEGLLEFNGIRWKLWKLPNKTAVRSVYVKNDKVYTGSFEEFGFWERDSKGNLTYNSLIKQNKDLKFNEEYWRIFSYKDTLFFRSFTKIYSLRGNEINLIPTEGTITFCGVVNNELLLYSPESGTFKLTENKFIPFSALNIPKNTIINSIKALSDSRLLISSKLDGCFIFDGKETKPWRSEVNPNLLKYELNSTIILNNGNLAFGTIKQGLYITDKLGNILFHLNKENGLINNTVLYQNISQDNQLWLGLDNGLVSVDLDLMIVIFNDVKGDLGAVYDIVNYKNTLFIGSNTGLYHIDKNKKIQFVEGTQGQVWDLKVVGEDLFCGHNTGTFLFKNNQLKKISDVNGGWVLKMVPGEKNMMIQGTYSGFLKYKKENGVWHINKISNFNKLIKYLVFEDKFTAWMAHPRKGLERIQFDKDFKKVISSQSYVNKGVWSTHNLKIFKIKNNIAFKTDMGWQRYEPLQDTIVPFDLLSKKIGKNSNIISEGEGTDTQLAVEEGGLIFVKPSFISEKKYYIPNELYKQRLVSGFERMSKVNDSIYALCLMDGFMLLNSSNFKFNSKLEKPVIECIRLKDELIDIKKDIIKTNFKNNNISIEIFAPNSRNVFFEYKLEPKDTVWKKNYNGEINFSNLSEGDYKLVLRAVSLYGENSEETILNYHIDPPWYRGFIGALVYLFLIVILIIVIYSYNHKKLLIKQRIMKIELEKEQRVILNEKKLENVKAINLVKHEALENEIKLKSKQLANTAMALVKKNELLGFIKKELMINKGKFDNQYAFTRIINQINNGLDHEDEWKLFEYNFNQVHKEFFDELRNKYPTLNLKDLKLCAYIKMNLSTKEIAPLLNISIRGVESHRFRLRKKLQLDKSGKDININAFLMKFSNS